MVLLLITVIVWSISFQFLHNFGLITDFTAPAAPLRAFAENKLAAALALFSSLSPHVFLAPLMEQWNMGWLPNPTPRPPSRHLSRCVGRMHPVEISGGIMQIQIEL